MDALDIFDNDLSEYDDEPKESIVNESYNQSRERLFDEDDEIYPSIVFLEKCSCDNLLSVWRRSSWSNIGCL